MQVPFSALYNQVKAILKIQVETFHQLGYPAITTQELWHYCVEKVWHKRDIQQLRLYELTAAIFSVNASDVVHYLQVKNLKEPSDVLLSEEEIHFLMNMK